MNGRSIPADPLPPSIVEGDESETTEWDHGEAAPSLQPSAAATPSHASLLWLTDALRAEDANVIELPGWDRNEPDYFWTDETSHHQRYDGDPVGWIWHHTATAHYVPYIKNAHGQSKANLWMGLWRDGTLFATGGGVPTVVFASGGPANFTAGSGRREVLVEFVANDVRFQGPQREEDTPRFFGNRHYGSTETVHPGDGSPLDGGVWELQLVVAALMCDHYGWSPWRHIGHLDHTHRKIDPRFEQGAPYTIGFMQDELRRRRRPAKEAMTPVRAGPGGALRTVRFGDGTNAHPDPVVKAAQIMLLHHGYRDLKTTDEEFGADGVFREGTKEAVQRFQADAGIPVTGEVDAITWTALDR
jgi:Putative peptidoglycan binding domain